jgi:hypothetical protein
MYKFYTGVGLILFLSLFIGCENNLNDSDGYLNIEGIWGKDGVYLNFSNKNKLWQCLLAMDSMPPYFNGDESYAFPDGFASYEDYINATKIPPVEYTFEGNNGYFENSVNCLTLYDNNAKYVIKYENNNSTLKLNCVTNNLLKISYDTSLYRPFNQTVRSYNNEDTYFDLNGVWIKKE